MSDLKIVEALDREFRATHRLDGSGSIQFGMAVASQVCEQREKEPRVDIKWLGEQLKKEAGIAIAYERGTRNPTGASDGTYAKLTVQNKRAEAAELALQTSQREFSQCNLRLDVEYQRAEGLKAALQAKEQELGQQKEGQEYLRDQIHTILQLPAYSLWTNVGLIEALTMRIESLAQARQQAIAECLRVADQEAEEFQDSSELCEKSGNHAGATHDFCGVMACKRVADKLRSLTPPPALTHTIGGADEPKECRHGYVRGECLEGCK